MLSPGDTWRVGVDRLGYPLRHWNEGANSAYVVRAGGRIEMVKTIPTAAAGVEELPRRGSVLPHLSAGSDVEPLSIIPWPNAISIESYRQAPAGLMPHGANAAAQSAITAFARLTADLFPAEGVVRQSAEGGAPVALEHRGDMGPEAYELVFAGDDIRLHATGHVGFLFGLVTLGQIWRGAQRSPRVFSFPEHGRITDAPGLGWRGAHLDVARHFYGSAEITQLLKIMAWNKLNRFHWHLTDDEGWRIEIDAYPELATIAAWRGHDLPVPPLLGSGPEPTGGVYSKAAIRDLVALGESLGIVLVPEIDVPGHSFATLAALLAAGPGRDGGVPVRPGVPNNCLNPARQETYRFLDTVLAEVLELFPARIIHIAPTKVPSRRLVTDRRRRSPAIERLCGREAAAGHAALPGSTGRRPQCRPHRGLRGSRAAGRTGGACAGLPARTRGHARRLGRGSPWRRH
ncbi:MAG: family 20 glycosylhydrolase [Devosia sp.]|nr:family 20 glycosylhydrolase [Devosia sp.]